jgi:hypothetical protein
VVYNKAPTHALGDRVTPPFFSIVTITSSSAVLHHPRRPPAPLSASSFHAMALRPLPRLQWHPFRTPLPEPLLWPVARNLSPSNSNLDRGASSPPSTLIHRPIRWRYPHSRLASPAQHPAPPPLSPPPPPSSDSPPSRPTPTRTSRLEHTRGGRREERAKPMRGSHAVTPPCDRSWNRLSATTSGTLSTSYLGLKPVSSLTGPHDSAFVTQ